MYSEIKTKIKRVAKNFGNKGVIQLNPGVSFAAGAVTYVSRWFCQCAVSGMPATLTRRFAPFLVYISLEKFFMFLFIF